MHTCFSWNESDKWLLAFKLVVLQNCLCCLPVADQHLSRNDLGERLFEWYQCSGRIDNKTISHSLLHVLLAAASVPFAAFSSLLSLSCAGKMFLGRRRGAENKYTAFWVLCVASFWLQKVLYFNSVIDSTLFRFKSTVSSSQCTTWKGPLQ